MDEPLDTPVSEVMTTPVRTVPGDLSAREAASVLVEEGIGSVVVESPAGILTKTDLVRGIHDRIDFGEATVSDLMSRPLVTVAPDDDVRTVVDRMEEHDVERLVVASDSEPVGVVSVSDLADVFAVDLDTAVGMFVGPASVEGPHEYECLDCGARTTAESRPDQCAECGGQLQNISVTRE
jgi:predicted transcriptional regulator/DNA-directed RNA polymerase subunit RPC12/RpoP